MTAEKTAQTTVNEMFDQAARFFQESVAAGIRLQQQSAKAMGEIVGGFTSPHRWQEQAQASWEQLTAAAEKSMSDAMELMTENTKTSLELLEKAFEAQVAVAKGDGQTQTRELWETAVGSYLRNAEIMRQANNRMLESWRQMADVLRSQMPPASGEAQEE
jgi:hypothetical protein